MRPPARIVVAACVLATLLTVPARAEPPACTWPCGPHATGDWGGARGWLAERGVALTAEYTTGFWSNVRGGFEKGTRWEGYAQWGVDAELDPQLGRRAAVVLGLRAVIAL